MSGTLSVIDLEAEFAANLESPTMLCFEKVAKVLLNTI